MSLAKNPCSQFGKKQTALFAAFLLVSFYLPVVLLWIGIIPFRYRFMVICGALAAMIAYTVFRKLRWHDLGFRCDTLTRSFFWNIGVSLLFLGLLYLMHSTGLIKKETTPFWPAFFIVYILVLSPAQEFFFRSILFAELTRMRPGAPGLIILISSLSFCFLHIIYQRPLMMLITLLMGIVWGVIYYRYPNFWGVTFSHAVLGTAAIAIGLI